MPAYKPVVPVGDWFAVTLLRDFHGDRHEWFVERVVLWLVPAELDEPKETEGDQVLDAVDGMGRRMGDGQTGFVHYVDGRDACPDGRSWSEVYASAPPVFDHHHTLSRNVTAQASGWWTKSP